jgi:hypothetical protein
LKLKLAKTLEDTGIGNAFLTRTLIAQEIRTRIDKWNCIKVKSFCITKGTITRIKKQPIEWEKIFASYLLDEELISRIYQELQKLNTKRTNKAINKWPNESNRQFSKEVQMTNKHMKKCLASLVIKKMQTKTRSGFHLTSEYLSSRKQGASGVAQVVE